MCKLDSHVLEAKQRCKPSKPANILQVRFAARCFGNANWTCAQGKGRRQGGNATRGAMDRMHVAQVKQAELARNISGKAKSALSRYASWTLMRWKPSKDANQVGLQISGMQDPDAPGHHLPVALPAQAHAHPSAAEAHAHAHPKAFLSQGLVANPTEPTPIPSRPN